MRMQEKSIDFYVKPLKHAANDIQSSLSETSN
ncbi:hypothetical protein B6A14_04125 [Polynucleobacter hirudinilacicola]|uniref:Uncharacterized protein n=1 Tax=Polynucleobacter hirudinilacicola TaxID=1743166 RepID=A0A210RZF0_9BURK|nr:hypothetical protein B6A14_04125 [Polynucleobacter hirudinilacicola]